MPLRETCRYFCDLIGAQGTYLPAESLQEMVKSALQKIRSSGDIEATINLSETDKIVARATRGFFSGKRLTGFAYVCRLATERAEKSLLEKISETLPPKETGRYVSRFICTK